PPTACCRLSLHDALPIFQETTEESIAETLRWLERCRFAHIRPILTPRFTPSCTDALLEQLGRLAAERGLYVQSHLSESTGEVGRSEEHTSELQSRFDLVC